MEVSWSCMRGRPALGGSRVDGFSSSGVLAPPYFSWLYQYDWFHYGCLSSKHWSKVKCRKRTKSLACVPFKEHCKLFQWPTTVMSLCLISQGYSRCLGLCLSLAYKQDHHDWLKLIIIYCWSLMVGCVLDWRHRRKGEYADICQQGEKRLRRPSGSPAPWVNCELNIHEEHPCLIRKI